MATIFISHSSSDKQFVNQRFYEDHNSAQPNLISILRENRVSEDSKAYFFQYSALEIRPVLRQAVMAEYQPVVFIQDPEKADVGLLGRDGGQAINHLDIGTIVKGSEDTNIIQDVHSSLCHILLKLIMTQT